MTGARTATSTTSDGLRFAVAPTSELTVAGRPAGPEVDGRSREFTNPAEPPTQWTAERSRPKRFASRCLHPVTATTGVAGIEIERKRPERPARNQQQSARGPVVRISWHGQTGHDGDVTGDGHTFRDPPLDPDADGAEGHRVLAGRPRHGGRDRQLHSGFQAEFERQWQGLVAEAVIDVSPLETELHFRPTGRHGVRVRGDAWPLGQRRMRIGCLGHGW